MPTGDEYVNSNQMIRKPKLVRLLELLTGLLPAPTDHLFPTWLKSWEGTRVLLLADKKRKEKQLQIFFPDIFHSRCSDAPFRMWSNSKLRSIWKSSITGHFIFGDIWMPTDEQMRCVWTFPFSFLNFSFSRRCSVFPNMAQFDLEQFSYFAALDQLSLGALLERIVITVENQKWDDERTE